MEITIKVLRKIYNMSQHELAKKSEMSTSSIGNIETGQKNITLNSVENIAKAFGIKAYELMKLFELEENGATEETIYDAYYELLKVANTLQAIRLFERGNIAKIALELGTVPSVLEKFEEGTAKPSKKMVEIFSKLFNIDLADLYKLFKLETEGNTFKEILIAYLSLKKQG